jgi:hypothetical protein
MSRNCHHDSSVEGLYPLRVMFGFEIRLKPKKKLSLISIYHLIKGFSHRLYMDCSIMNSYPGSSRHLVEIKDTCSNCTISTVRVCDQGFSNLKLLKTQNADFRVITVRYRA